jgi:hypothetical protein
MGDDEQHAQHSHLDVGFGRARRKFAASAGLARGRAPQSRGRCGSWEFSPYQQQISLLEEFAVATSRPSVSCFTIRYRGGPARGKPKEARTGRADRPLLGAPLVGCFDQAVLISPSWVSAVTPSSRPISSTILRLITSSTVVPLKCILRPVAAGRPPISRPCLRAPSAGRGFTSPAGAGPHIAVPTADRNGA